MGLLGLGLNAGEGPVYGPTKTFLNNVLLPNGKLGIGTLTPSSGLVLSTGTRLHILGSGGSGAAIQDTSAFAYLNLIGHGETDIILQDTTATSGQQVMNLVSGNGNLSIRSLDDSYGSPATLLTVTHAGQVGIGGSPAASAALDIQSVTGALLVPRLTTTQKNAFTAVNGMMVYDSTLNKFQGYENGAWTSFI